MIGKEEEEVLSGEESGEEPGLSTVAEDLGIYFNTLLGPTDEE